MTPKNLKELDSKDFIAHKTVRHLFTGSEYWRRSQIDRTIEEWSAVIRNHELSENLLESYGSPLCIKGDFGDLPAVVVLYLLYASQATGQFEAISSDTTIRFQFYKGQIIGLGAKNITKSLESLLVRSNLVASDELPELRAIAAQKGQSLFAFLIKSNQISLDQYRHFVQTYAIENLVAVFSWREGRFEFVEKQMKRSGSIQIDPLDLILNTARRCFVHEEFENSIDDQKVIFRVSPHLSNTASLEDMRLGPLEGFIFSLINGTRNLGQIVRICGLTEKQVVAVLYQIALLGLIRRSKEVVEYEDKQYAELDQVINTIFDVHQIITERLLFELGDAGTAYLDEAASRLSVKDQKLFANLAIDLSRPLEMSVILKNITMMAPSFELRFDFIEAFCYLDKQILFELLNFLGPELARDTIEQVKEKALNIRQFAMAPELKGRLLRALTDVAAANLES